MSEPEYIARISYGKDSLKMLEVIHSRGLPLDRITTTDVWATDTISANLPPVEAFKADGHTVHDFDKRFRWEEMGYIDMRRPFRWDMLEKKPAFQAWQFEELSFF